MCTLLAKVVASPRIDTPDWIALCQVLGLVAKVPCYLPYAKIGVY